MTHTWLSVCLCVRAIQYYSCYVYVTPYINMCVKCVCYLCDTEWFVHMMFMWHCVCLCVVIVVVMLCYCCCSFSHSLSLSVTLTMSACVCLCVCVCMLNYCSSASNSTYSHAFLRSVVCLSVVCNIPFDGFRCHLAGTLVGSSDTFQELDGCPWPPGEREIWGSNPQPKHAIANFTQTVSPVLPPGEYKRGVGWTWDSTFCQITVVLVPLC